MGQKLPREFYIANDAIQAAQKLIGSKLFTKINGELTSGIITETEAYMGEIDKACHAYGGKKTERTKVLYKKGGKAYIYLVYGLHYLLNATIAEEDNPQCVLIRTLLPVDGIEIMKWRRYGMNHHQGNQEKQKDLDKIANGPAKLTQALGIDKNLYGNSLLSRKIWIEEGIEIPTDMILHSPRIGIEYAEEFKGKEWRYTVENAVVENILSKQD